MQTHRTHPTAVPRTSPLVMACVIAGALAALDVAAPTASHAQPTTMRVTRDQMTRIAPDSTVRTSVVILGRTGQDSARLTGGALTLARGEFAVLQTVGGVREVEDLALWDWDPDQGLDGMPVNIPAGLPQLAFFALPIRLITPDATLQSTWVLRPVYKVASRMRWDAAQQVFRGALFLAIEDSLRRSESRPLPTPVRFALLTDADSIAPDQFAFEHTNLPLRRVELVARRALDSLRVQLVPDFDVAGVDVWVPVEPALRIETTPRRIAGWGLGTARVVVHMIGATPDTSRSASVIAFQGELDAIDIAFGRAGTATTQLRSQGGGTATLMAGAPGFGEATTTIDFVLPWLFIVAALLGGVAGGILAALQTDRKEGARRAWGEYALKGVLAGVIGAVAWYGLGVNLLQFDLGVPRQNEFAVFALAALIGFFGIPRIDAKEPTPA